MILRRSEKINYLKKENFDATRCGVCVRGLSPVIEMAGQRGKRKLIAAKLRAGVGDDVIKQSSGVTERLIRSVNYQMKKKEVKAAASISIAQLPPDGPPARFIPAKSGWQSPRYCNTHKHKSNDSATHKNRHNFLGQHSKPPKS